MTPRCTAARAADLPALRTPAIERPADPAKPPKGKGRGKAPDQIFHCRLAYALAARRAVAGADEQHSHVRPLFCALLSSEGARRPIVAAILSHGYLESPHDRGNPRKLEFLKRVGYRHAYQATAAGPSIHSMWVPGYFELEPPANADLDDADDGPDGPLVRLCSMPPLEDLRAGLASAGDRQRWADALAWAEDLGLHGPGPDDPRRETFGPAAAWWAAQVDRRVASPMLHDPRFYVLTLLAAARSSPANGMLAPKRTWHDKGEDPTDRSRGACALWAAGEYPGAEDWARGQVRGHDAAHFAEYGLRAREFGYSDPILTIARDGALRHMLARECRAFEAACSTPHAAWGAYEAAVAASEAERLEALAARAEAEKKRASDAAKSRKK